MPMTLSSERVYSGQLGSVSWQGFYVNDLDEFRRFLCGPVRDRAKRGYQELESHLRSLPSTGMASATIERVLRHAHDLEDWEIGEVLAECLLQLCPMCPRSVVWPWSTLSDKRSPGASLPGTDLVGFCTEGAHTVFLFGEVKTSADGSSPPRVLRGRSGLTWQLYDNANCADRHCTLLLWLEPRCRSIELRQLFDAAAKSFLESSARDILLVGILLRDTPPSASDVLPVVEPTHEAVASTMRVEVSAWYLPVAIGDWQALLAGGSE